MRCGADVNCIYCWEGRCRNWCSGHSCRVRTFHHELNVPTSLQHGILVLFMAYTDVCCQVTTTVYCIPLKKRPAIQGVIGAVFGLGIILGPLIGGAFTSHVSWRWCFYINLPIGGVAMIVTVICLEIPKQDTAKIPWANKLRQLDLLGSACLVPSVICLVLALQWGGQTYPVSCSFTLADTFYRLMLTVLSGTMAVLLPC